MCGIVAFFSHRDPISDEALQRATHSLHHRGPDGRGHWISSDRRVALGHTRLSIIDLSDRRSADRQRGRPDPHRRQWRILRLRGDPARTRAIGSPPAHALGQRDCPASLRRSRRSVPAPVAGRVRVRALGSKEPNHLCGARPLWHQALFYACITKDALFRVGGEGVVCRRSAGSMGLQSPSITRSRSADLRCERCSMASSRFRPATT